MGRLVFLLSGILTRLSSLSSLLGWLGFFRFATELHLMPGAVYVYSAVFSPTPLDSNIVLEGYELSRKGRQKTYGRTSGALIRVIGAHRLGAEYVRLGGRAPMSSMHPTHQSDQNRGSV